MSRIKQFLFITLVLLSACTKVELSIEKDQAYSAKSEVALYIHTYDELPPNYLTKDEAYALGWDAEKGNLWDVSDKMSIGGDRFYNREGSLPENKRYHECDIDYQGGYRGAKRLVYSDDGWIYYTADHYDSFELLYEGAK
jgi:guanyl-specific ribonuclease Sa